MWMGTIVGLIGLVVGATMGALRDGTTGLLIGGTFGGAIGYLAVMFVGRIHARDIADSYHKVTCADAPCDGYVKVDPRPMLTAQPPRVVDCSRWPEARECSRGCASTVDV